MKMQKRFLAFLLLITAVLSLFGCFLQEKASYSIGEIPPFSNEPYVVVNDNQPNFSKEQLKSKSYEKYAPLDILGRCGPAIACIGKDLMPDEDRKSIGQVKPSGWHTVKYDCVDGKYLYNRCHLIGFQLTGENANEQNLITGTRYMNVDGVLPFENMIADYIKETDHHVLYRVTPIFDGNNLVASGVQLEAFSVEDQGAGVCFNVYAYNCQPGVVIDYATGASRLENEPEKSDSDEAEEYILNVNSKKIHLSSCSGAKNMKESNKEISSKSITELIAEGYEPCGQCLKD